jgi:hypothetical protein
MNYQEEYIRRQNKPLNRTVIEMFTIPETQTAHDKQGFLVYHLYAKVYLFKFIP